ncbi:RHS repeat-associated core domain-containing protein [Sphaerisporangium sp. B11E5]|uniref:RHS repeat-associated core domain-containing protein n=1 Tax=Sphaerisporangium sp. B11E5 TaxID=3153563 RepID=UPI00325CB49E
MRNAALSGRLRRSAARVVTTVTALLLAGSVLVVWPPAPARADGERSGNAGQLLQDAGVASGGPFKPGRGSLNGDYTTGVPIEVPAGRQGLAPQVRLSYTSNGATHGGLAAGWSLMAGGAITVDGSAGTLRPEWADGGSAEAPRNFVNAAGQALVEDTSLPVTSPGAVGYRAVGDNLSARYEYHGGSGLPWWWIVKHSDGRTSYFGEKDKHPYSYAPLVRVTELNGFNDPAELKYGYTTVGRTAAEPTGTQPREYLPTTIDYETQGSQEPYARVEFTWAAPSYCGSSATALPTGARSDYRLGFPRLSGTRKLTAIKTYTKKTSGNDLDLRSLYSLGYNVATETCNGSAAEERGAPYRELASVQRTVYRPQVAGQAGPAVTVLPTTKFTYGQAASYAKNSHYGPEVNTGVQNLAMPESIETNQLLQLHPDGPIDTTRPEAWVWTPHTPYTACDAPFCPVPVWDEAAAENRDPASYVPPPDMGAWVLATGQSSGESLAVMHVDINGDNKPDMLKRRGGLPKLAAAAPQTGGCMVDVFLNTSVGFVQSPAFPSFSLRDKLGDIPVGAATPEDGAGELLCALNRSFSNDDSGGWRGDVNRPCTASGEVWQPGYTKWGATAAWGSMQQAKHAFLDWDQDGLPDLVTQTIASVDCPYASTRGVPAPTFHDDVVDEEPDATPDPHWVPEYLDDVVGSSPSEIRRAITKRQKYLWVYRNTGNGFAATPVRVAASSATAPGGPPGQGLMWDNIARVPQASVLAPYSGPTGWTASASSLGDFTGDGHLDLWFPTRTANIGPAPASPATWPSVELPQGAGAPATERRLAEVEDPDPEPHWPGQYTSILRKGMLDINGDGLPDLVEAVGQPVTPGEIDYSGTKVNFNVGRGFATAADDGEVMFSQDAEDTTFLDSFHVDRLSEKNWQKYGAVGDRWGKTRLNDLDRDGLPDLLLYDKDENRAQVYAGGGRQWVSAHPADVSVAQHFAGRVRGAGTGFGGTVNEFDERADYRYVATHHAIDVNGDGLQDLVGDGDNDGVVTVRYAKPVIGSGDSAAPARLLRTITNGTGGKTTVSYSSDAAAGKWVASSVIVDPGHGQPAVTSDFRYIKPAFVADLYGRKSFRGYEETHTLLNTSTPGVADNVTHVTQYTYQVTTGGLPIMHATVLGHAVNATGIAGDQAGVMSIAEPSYHIRDLPGGLQIPAARPDHPMRTVLPSTTITTTCTGTGGQTFDACRDSGPEVTTRTTWQAKQIDGHYVMELPERSEIQFVNGEGDDEIHRTGSTFNLHWNTAGFRLAPATTVDTAVVDGAEQDLGEVRYTYDTVDFSRVQTVTVDDAKAGVPDRTTRYHYYNGGAKHGLLHKVWAPEQVHKYDVDDATGPGFTAYDYDASGLHVTKVVNPLGHTVETVPDPATGEPLDSFGPNYTCPDGGDAGTAPDPATGCDFATARGAGLVERSHVDVDGLGRPVKNIAYRIGDPGSGVETFRATYNDLAYESDPEADPRLRVSMVTESLVGDSADGDRQYSHETVELDGLGRGLRSAVVQDDEVTRVTTIGYNHQGLPVRTTGPAGDGQGTITAVIGYDGLGRTVLEGEQVSATDTRVLARQSYSYDGLSVTATQHTAVFDAAQNVVDPAGDGSPAAQKVVTTDAAGQVVTVAEKWNTGRPPAETRYTYDPMGNVATVTDADGVTTALSHDYSGLRRTVTRPGPGTGRVWTFGYDRNGRQTALTEPVPAGYTAANFTHRIEYDDLGRTVKTVPAPRGLDTATREELLTGPDHPTVYTYDTPHESLNEEAGEANHTIGRLTSVSSPAATGVNRFNAFGLPTATSQQLSEALTGQGGPLAGLAGVADTLTSTVTYDETGLLAASLQYTARTGAGQAGFTGPAVHAAGSDRDGAPSAIGVDLGPRGVMTIAHDRNAAGLTTARRVNTGELPGFAETLTRYTRDRYGRLTGLQTVGFDGNGGELQRYKQTLSYYDNGQIRQTDDYLGETSQSIATTYTYNYRGELESATASDYYALLGVRASGRLDLVNIIDLGDPGQPAAGKRLTSRGVTYRYQTADDPLEEGNAGRDPLRLDGLEIGDGTGTGDLAGYTYDEAGNTTKRTVTDPGTGTTAVEYTQTWDGPSSLRKVTNETTGESETYFYDGGARVAAVHKNAQGAVVGVRRYFGAQEIVYAPGQQPEYRQTLTLAGDTIGRVDGNAATGVLEHYTTSPQGHHVLALAAEDAATRRVTRYGALGEVLSSHTAAGQPLPDGKYPQEFNGKDRDPVSDLLFYGARSYDPLAVQWASPDPLYLGEPDLDVTDPTRANLYTFTGNDPVNLIDPTGLDTCEADPAECTKTGDHFVQCTMDNCEDQEHNMDWANGDVVMEGEAPKTYTVWDDGLGWVEGLTYDEAMTLMVMQAATTPPTIGPNGSPPPIPWALLFPGASWTDLLPGALGRGYKSNAKPPGGRGPEWGKVLYPRFKAKPNPELRPKISKDYRSRVHHANQEKADQLRNMLLTTSFAPDRKGRLTTTGYLRVDRRTGEIREVFTEEGRDFSAPPIGQRDLKVTMIIDRESLQPTYHITGRSELTYSARFEIAKLREWMNTPR